MMSEQARRGRPATQLSLSQLAERINLLSVEIADKRLEVAVLISEAQDRVSRETNFTFAEWARHHLRRPDGEPWALSYLYKMAMFGRTPTKLVAHRDSVAKSGRTARAAWREATKIHQIRVDSVADEVNFLMTAWERASDEARRQFLKLIGKI